MKKLLYPLAVVSALSLTTTAIAATHKVEAGESMWKIAVKYQVGLTEIKEANPHIKNPELVYPGDIITIPEKDSSVRAYEKEVVRLVNEERVKAGVKPLTEDWELSRVARYKSQDMRDNNYFSHTSPVYGSPFDMIKNFGITYRSAGENIARGQRSPEAVVNAEREKAQKTRDLIAQLEQSEKAMRKL